MLVSIRYFHCLLLLNALFSCKPSSNNSSTGNIAAKQEIAGIQPDTTWSKYKGIIPCADCPGIEIELSLKDAFKLENYLFELKEIYLEAENGKNKSFVSNGTYNYRRGNSNDADATIIVLNDDSTEGAKSYFLKVSENELKFVNKNGDEFDSKLNYSLIKTGK